MTQPGNTDNAVKHKKTILYQERFTNEKQVLAFSFFTLFRFSFYRTRIFPNRVRRLQYHLEDPK